MVFKNFRLIIVARVALIVGTVLLFFYLLNNTDYYVSLTLTGILIIIEVVSLIHYAEKTNRKITSFLESIRHNDYISTIPVSKEGRSFDDLHSSFNEVINEIKKTRASEQEHFNYLKTAVEHINIGIVAFHRNGDVDLFNAAVKNLFNIDDLRNINQLAQIEPELPQKLLNLGSGDHILIKLFVKDKIRQLSVSTTEFRLRGKFFVLISLQDIHSELEEKEIESWQKLIRVLTHEIMNSITPISSLANTVEEALFDEDGKLKPLDEDDTDTVQTGLKTINKRSQGLLNFVQLYRSLTRVPRPNFKHFQVQELFDDMKQIMEPKTQQAGIECVYKIIPPGLKLLADPDLLEQVLINLVVNAIHALDGIEKPRITLEAFKDFNERVIIKITDNGKGIKPDIMDKIFVPFFTSKKEGSGVGLSLSRQIMRMHKGNVGVKSTPGEGAVFILTF